MAQQKKTLIFIPLPVISHLLATIKLAKLLTDHDDSLSITFLIFKLNSDDKITSYTKNSPNSRLNFVHLERDESAVRAAVAAVSAGPAPASIAGFVFDILCSSMMDVAAELGVPSYIFFTCGAAILGLLFRLEALMGGRNRALAAYEGSNAEILVSTYVNC